MEVLIGTFVLSVGMLGLAALIPIGRFAIVETGKSDRAGACGRAGLREVKVQRMLDPETWYDVDLNPIVGQVDGTQFAESFAIDPMQIARASSDVSRFPYDTTGPSMTRITLKSMLDISGSQPVLSLPLARRSFVWRDELLFEMPDDETSRPRRLVRDGSGVVRPYPKIFGNEDDFLPAEQLVPQTDENYSWMVTVTPAIVENPFPGEEKQLYSVSVVVFWKRDYTLDSTERVVKAEMFGGGYGGGDVRLFVADPKDAAKLRVKENQWLMLCGQANGTNNNVFQWYRVISAAELDGNERFVTLAGPDWNIDTTQAVLFDGVIGVYTTTVELDRDLMWRGVIE